MQFKRFILLGLMSCAGLVACQANGTGAAKSSLHIEKVEVYRSDNSTQCGGAGVAPETIQRELGDIQVFVARKDYLRGVAFPSVCGGVAGDVNVYTIAKQDQAAAEKLGFRVFSAVE
ncbi:hypothetical protein [Kingella kingae]|uniref:hypothetical protein n=1 Tax=Kingella kingae TaxID=504 RepID=UPI00040777E4|nr:hypothetical protein [Kingella kingae]MDK4624032.1 hypothetical protein [Kingella kingae]MDK4659612.1 hypothetical protein [Kingella kingae]MDK4667511.1 hypothetical protein [Kingella kingae]MDK4685918.1 hypothetical protein [Kingella kingae]